MDRLTRLPEELTSEIVRQVAHQSLPALASVSRQFHRLVIPRLYRCVYYDEIYGHDSYRVNSAIHIGTKGTTAIRPNRGDWPLCQSSRIFNLNLFLRTINTCPETRSYITTAGFDLFNIVERKTTIICYIIDLLLPSLQILDVSPFIYNVEPTIEKALKSLRVSYNFWTQQDSARTYLFSLFQIPTLRNLFIETESDWDTFRTRRSQHPAHRSRSRTSNVTSLSFTIGMPFTDDLTEILSWPKSLEVFELGPPASLFQPIIESLPSPRKLAEVLSLQQHSLRELYITDHQCKQSETISDDATLGDLHNFGALNRLCVLNHCLVISNEHTRPFTKIDLTRPQIWEILPPSIGELRLEIEPDSRLYDSFDFPLADKARELATWLSELVKHKRTHSPNLQEIVVWHPGLSRDRQTLLLKELRNIPNLLQEFETNEVRLLFSRDHWPSVVVRMELSEFCYELVSIRR